MKLIEWFERLFHRKKKLEEGIREYDETWLAEQRKKIEDIRRRERMPSLPQKPRKAIHQDVGKFFKGKSKHQHKTYRRSVKRKVKPKND